MLALYENRLARILHQQGNFRKLLLLAVLWKPEHYNVTYNQQAAQHLRRIFQGTLILHGKELMSLEVQLNLHITSSFKR
jgi:hypothetical protein